MRRNEVGILTVARCLSEGVGIGVKGFVVTDSGLQEIHSFAGRPGTFRAVLAPYRQYGGASQVDVRLDTEVFLARYDLTGMAREDVLQLAGRAASVHALSEAGKSLYGSPALPPDTDLQRVTAPKQVVDEHDHLVSNWQG